MRRLYQQLKVRGCKAPNKRKYVGIKQHKQEWFVPFDELLRDPAAAFQSLAEQGVPVGGRGFVAQVMEEVHGITEFPDEEVLTHSGWNGPLYARIDGEVIVPAATAKAGAAPSVGFRRQFDRYCRSGSSKHWLRKVAEPLKDSETAAILMGIAFAATVRPLIPYAISPIACQIVAAKNVSVVQRVLLSVIGSAHTDHLAPDPIKRLLARPERLIQGACDQLMVIDDLRGYLCGGSGKKRRDEITALVFDHLLSSEGGNTNATGNLAPSFVIVEDRPLAELLELDGEAAARLDRRLPTITLQIDAFAPRADEEACRTSMRLQKAFSLMADHYGTALRAFQRALVEDRAAQGPAAFQDQLARDYEMFMGAVGEPGRYDDAVEAMVPFFALTEVALKAAERLAVIPAAAINSAASWALFKQFLQDRPHPPSAAAILLEIASRPEVLDVDSIDPDQGKAELREVPAFKKRIRDESELWVTTDQKKRTFDWPRFKKLPDFKQFYVGRGEGDRDGKKCKIGEWRTRVLRFRLPKNNEASE